MYIYVCVCVLIIADLPYQFQDVLVTFFRGQRNTTYDMLISDLFMGLSSPNGAWIQVLHWIPKPIRILWASNCDCDCDVSKGPW